MSNHELSTEDLKALEIKYPHQLDVRTLIRELKAARAEAAANLTIEPAWQPIDDSTPQDTLIQITNDPNSGWSTTGSYTRYEEDEHYNHCSIVHYNGDMLLNIFYATQWKPLTPPDRKSVV